MSETEKLKMLKSMTGEEDEDVLLFFLKIAASKILRKAYPFDREIREVPCEYAMNQIEIACYLLNKRGAEGETSHSENGINRSYESASVPDSMLRDIIPFGKVLHV